MANTADWAREDELTPEAMPAPTGLPPSPPRPPAPPTTGGSVPEDEGYAVGEAVRLVGGPFADFPGTIIEIDADGRWLRVAVNIFERQTPVRLKAGQICRP